MDSEPDFKNVLMQIRRFNGWSQRELSVGLGISQSMVSSIERGDRKPSVIIAYKIEKLFSEVNSQKKVIVQSNTIVDNNEKHEKTTVDYVLQLIEKVDKMYSVQESFIDLVKQQNTMISLLVSALSDKKII